MREFQIEVDDIYACPGSCTGCVLSIQERRLLEPAMDEGVMDLTLDRLTEYVPCVEGLEAVNVAFGIADHLMLPNEYTVGIYRKAVAFLERVGYASPGRGSVFFSTSLIGKIDKIIPRLQAIADATRDGPVPFYPIAVFDPVLMDSKFAENYATIIRETQRIFGRTDLSVNMSGIVVETITPEEMVAFARDRGFDEVTINWSPTLGNVSATCIDMNALVAWFKGFAVAAEREGVEYSFGPVIRKSIDVAMCGRSDPSVPEPLPALIKRQIVRRTVERSLQFDHKGNFFPKLEAIGDVAYNERFGLKPIANVADGPIAESLAKVWANIERQMVATHIKTPVCVGCPVLDVCAITGFHVYSHVLDLSKIPPTSNNCRHVARDLIDFFMEQGGRHD